MRLMLSVVLYLFAASLPAYGADGAESRTTIRLFVHYSRQHVVIDQAPRGGKPSKGDVRQVTSTLENLGKQFGRKNGAIVGGEVRRLTFLSSSKTTATIRAKLPGGTLRATGSIGTTLSDRLRVTGGTGAFAGARGTLDLQVWIRTIADEVQLYTLSNS